MLLFVIFNMTLHGDAVRKIVIFPWLALEITRAVAMFRCVANSSLGKFGYVVCILWAFLLASYCVGEVVMYAKDIASSRKVSSQEIAKNNISQLDILIKKYPKESRYLYERAILSNKLKDYQEAYKYINLYIKMSSNDYRAYELRSSLFFRSGHYNYVISDSDKILKINPDNLMAYINKGNAYYQLKEYEKAIVAFKKVKDLNSSYSGGIVKSIERAEEKLKMQKN